MRTTIAFCLLLSAAAAVAAPPPACLTPLPKPKLVYTGTTNGVPGYIDKWFRVENYSLYSNTLFAASPNLPACGLNTSASRTWLEIYTDTGTWIYGFCALSQNTQMQKLGFPKKQSAPKPKGVYIVLRDRLCNRSVKSDVNYNF